MLSFSGIVKFFDLIGMVNFVGLDNIVVVFELSSFVLLLVGGVLVFVCCCCG